MWVDRHNRNVVNDNKKNGVCLAKSLCMWDKKIMVCTSMLLVQGHQIYERKMQREKKNHRKRKFY